MTAPTAYHQIGKFIVSFQHVEASINEVLALLTNADDEAIRIMINELGYAQRLKITDVMFARFFDLRHYPETHTKTEFHNLVVKLGQLGERRNDLVHSKYTPLVNVEGAAGLLRENSKLRSSKGIREQEEEELLPEAFSADFERLAFALKEIETFRLKIIGWAYPNVDNSR